MVLLVACPAAALGKASIRFSTIEMDGAQMLDAEAASGLRLRSVAGLAGATLAGGGEHLLLTTTNYTAPSAVVAGQPDYDGGNDTFRSFLLHAADAAATDLDVLVTPLPGQPAPRLSIEAATSTMQGSQTPRLTETAYVKNTRPVHSSGVASGLEWLSSAGSSVRFEGSFRVSVWSWNLTVADAAHARDVTTGSWRSAIAAAPMLGTSVVYEERAQVAQLEVRDGWLWLGELFGAELAAYAPRMDVAGSGTAQVAGAQLAEGDRSGLALAGSEVRLEGQYVLDAARASGDPHIVVESLVGTLGVDGMPVDLGGSGSLRGATVQRDPLPSQAWAIPVALLAVVGFAVVVKGPALTGRFNRIQHRFERRDYAGVLARIDGFTRRRRYARRASFIKAVSLLSIGDYREASLFLNSLGPGDSPDAATKAFLQACAAAGLGQDSTAIERLSSCFKEDPSYIEEARTVPVLKGYLPYFSLADDGEGAT